MIKSSSKKSAIVLYVRPITAVNFHWWGRCSMCPHYSLFHWHCLRRPLPSDRINRSLPPSSWQVSFILININYFRTHNSADQPTRQDVERLQHETLRLAVRLVPLLPKQFNADFIQVSAKLVPSSLPLLVSVFVPKLKYAWERPPLPVRILTLGSP